MSAARLIDGRLVDAAFLRDPKLMRVLTALNGDREETRVVGGAVRNALLGEPVGDIDLATTATTDETTRRGLAAGMKVVPTGIEHGTVTLVIDGKPFEVTTLREDVETDGRHAKVRFGRDFVADALRRDFTMNALSLDADGRVHDHVGGLADLAARRVRFIGDARQRIREDFLRIARLFRFHAAYGEGAMDAEAFAAAIAESAGLASLSRERIRAELLKLLVARRAAEVADEMSGAGLLGPLLGGIAIPARLERIAAIEAARESKPDAILRLGALAVLVVENAERLRDMLRLSNAEAERLARAAKGLAELHGCETPPHPGLLRELLFHHGRRGALDAIQLAQAEACVAPDDPAWTSAWRFLSDTPEPRLPFSGTDLLARGVPSGRAMGDMLKRLQASWIRAGFPNDPKILGQLLDAATAGSE
jgi:poly(A) polymerase